MINLAFNIFNNGDFEMDSFSNTVLAILDKMKYLYKRT